MGATPIIIKYPLDLTGSASSNAIGNESHTVPRDTSRGFALDYGPFYTKSLVIRKASDGEALIAHVDYIALHQYQEATLVAGQEICAAVLITNADIEGELLVDYQVVGGGFSSSVSVIQELVAALEIDDRAIAWGDIIGKLEAFPPSPHYHDLDDFYGFEYMIAAIDRMTGAIMHGDYYDHELLRQRISNLRVELQQLIDDQAEALTLHLGDFANPHKVTKAQIGLDLVDNFATATVAEASAGLSQTLFMTPYNTFAAIQVLAGGIVSSHSSRTDNPHSVTKAQVGLGSVENYGIATVAEATAGASNLKYMTPYLTKQAINTLAGDLISSHVNRLDNPHSVTKAQVGLSDVDNYATASQAEAQATAATSTLPTNKFMTIRRVAEMIDARGGTQLQAHVSNTSNPHGVTKAQVGLGSVENYGIATSAQVTAAQTTSTASNAAYITPLRLVEYVINRLGNVLNYGIATQAEAEVTSTGSSSNVKYMTPLRVLQAIDKRVYNDFATHINQSISTNPHGTTKADVGLGSVQNYGLASQAQAQVMTSGASNAVYMTPWSTYYAVTAHLGRTDAASVLTSAVNHINNTSNPHGTTKAHVGLGSVANYGIAAQTDAETGTSNGLYMTPLRTFQAIARYLNNVGWSTVSAHVSRTDNPHSVTKAQVGLGSVANYGIAAQTDAETGTSNGLYMTPLRTFQAIARYLNNVGWSSVTAHLSNTSNPHSVTKAQVGLGSVANYGIAAQTDAEAGTSNGLYMTPLRTFQAIARYLNNVGWSTVSAHVSRTDNPHSVTKAQVGLGSVVNVAQASNSDMYDYLDSPDGYPTQSLQYATVRGVYQMLNKMLARRVKFSGSVTAMAGEWTFVTNVIGDGSFYHAKVKWGGSTSTGGWSYFAGMLSFGSITGRSNPKYGVFPTGDATGLQLASPSGSTAGTEGCVVIGAGSYGEVCRLALFPGGLYVYRNTAMGSDGNIKTGTAAGSISVSVEIVSAADRWL